MADLAWRLLREGYEAIEVDRTSRGGDGDYQTRLLGRRATVVRSREGARVFYDESVVRRKGAIPPPLAWVLFGPGAVHALDGNRHRDRKLLFVDILAGDQLDPVVAGVARELRGAAASWAGCPTEQIELFPQLVLAYGRSVLRWAGVDLRGDEEAEVCRMLAQIVDGFGFAGRAYARAVRQRVRADRWAADLVRDVRAGRRTPQAGSALARIAAATDLDTHTAGVELLNVLRPTVAVAWLATFAAVRLAHAPSWRDHLADPGGAGHRLAFAQEVRRTTPFAPALAGRVTRSARLGDRRISAGEMLVLDIIGIHHDPVRWPEPDVFAPERFLEGLPGAFDLVPQGGGHPSGHRCPGESLALRILAATVQVLAEVDLELVGEAAPDLSRIPTLPQGRVRVRAVSRSGRAGLA